MPFGNLKTKFIIWFIPLILFISLSFLTFFIYQSNHLIKEELTNFGFHLIRDFSYGSKLAVASEDPVLLHPFLEGTFEEEDVLLVTIYNQRGHIIVSKEKTGVEERMPEDIMGKLLKEKKPIKKTGYTQEGQEIYNFYSPILATDALISGSLIKEKEIIGFVRIGLSLEKIANQRRKVLAMGLGITVLVIFFGIAIAVFLAGRMTNPIRELTRGAEAIGKGNFEHRIKIKTGDEIEELGKKFNQMAEVLQKSHAAIEESKTVLEIKVRARTKELRELAERQEEIIKERTKEIQERMEELERFQRLAIGRELKMIELKKEIKKVKEELEKYKK